MVRLAPLALPTIAALLLGGLIATGCSARKGPVSGSYVRPGPAASHAIHDDSLRGLMGSLARLTENYLPQEMDLSAQRQRRLDELAQNALLMRDAARRIPDVLEDVRLDTANEKYFRQLARELEQAADELAMHAERADLTQANEAMDCITATCANCHGAFRVLPVIQPEE